MPSVKEICRIHRHTVGQGTSATTYNSSEAGLLAFPPLGYRLGRSTCHNYGRKIISCHEQIDNLSITLEVLMYGIII